MAIHSHPNGFVGFQDHLSFSLRGDPYESEYVAWRLNGLNTMFDLPATERYLMNFFLHLIFSLASQPRRHVTNSRPFVTPTPVNHSLLPPLVISPT
jgi:hypothetical protein